MSDSLTPLKKHNSVNPPEGNPEGDNEFLVIDLKKIRSKEIAELTEIKDKLFHDINILGKGKQTLSTLNQEIAQLDKVKQQKVANNILEISRLQRNKLGTLVQLKRLKDIVDVLKEKEYVTKKSISEFSQQELEGLSEVATDLFKELKAIEDKIKQKDSKLDEEKAGLVEIAQYYWDLAQDLLKTASLEARREVLLNKMTLDLTKKAATVKTDRRIVDHQLKASKSKLRRASATLLKANKKEKEVNDSLSKRTYGVEKAEKGLSLRESKLKSWDSVLKTQEKRQKIREIQLKDKDQTLKRVANRLRKKVL